MSLHDIFSGMRQAIRNQADQRPNFTTSAAKLGRRVSRKGCSTWLGLRIWSSELDFEAILNFSLTKVVISVLDRGVAKLLSLTNMSSKRPAPTSAGSPSTRPPT